MESGRSKKTGETWQKRGFLLEISGRYPEQAYFTVFGDRVGLCPEVGDDVVVEFNFRCREYEGRYYNEHEAWRIIHPRSSAAQPLPEEHGGDLPF